MNFEEFAKINNVVLKSERVRVNPNMKDSEKNMDNWNCSMYCDNGTYTLYFSKGFAHKGKAPTVQEVLECLHSDISYIVAGYDCEDFIKSMGYDCCEGRKIYKAIQKEHEALNRLFGDLFDDFMECEE